MSHPQLIEKPTSEYEYTTIERALLVGWRLRSGESLRVKDVSRDLQLSESQAWKLLEFACRVLTVTADALPEPGKPNLYYMPPD